mmetsp:Transcript_21519/g.43322  ORF Transcript_21519/g.43322 Transcript_21519/m.43322 type:complete len:222 (-) Transcript_21519:139-804(-)
MPGASNRPWSSFLSARANHSVLAWLATDSVQPVVPRGALRAGRSNHLLLLLHFSVDGRVLVLDRLLHLEEFGAEELFQLLHAANRRVQHFRVLVQHLLELDYAPLAALYLLLLQFCGLLVEDRAHWASGLSDADVAEANDGGGRGRRCGHRPDLDVTQGVAVGGRDRELANGVGLHVRHARRVVRYLERSADVELRKHLEARGAILRLLVGGKLLLFEGHR